MANSIVFQNSAEQLKTAIYGYDGTNYQPIKVNTDGSLDVSVGTIKGIGTINTISNVVNVGTLNTVNNVVNLGTLNTVSDVINVGTLNTVNSVVNLGTLSTVSNVVNLGTLSTVSNVVNLGTLNTVSNIINLGTLNSIIGTVKVNLADRTFTSTTYTLEIGASTTTYTELLNISKYQDTSWYLRNITATANREPVTIRLAVTPSINLSSYPRVLISETATVNSNPKVITNDYYMKYITAQIANATATSQTVVIIFNGRY